MLLVDVIRSLQHPLVENCTLEITSHLEFDIFIMMIPCLVVRKNFNDTRSSCLKLSFLGAPLLDNPGAWVPEQARTVQWRLNPTIASYALKASMLEFEPWSVDRWHRLPAHPGYLSCSVAATWAHVGDWKKQVGGESPKHPPLYPWISWMT
jgi:hypothetical protein